MSRKDFQLIADVIRLLPSFECSQAGDVVRHSAIVARFVESLATTNPRVLPRRTSLNHCMMRMPFAFAHCLILSFCLGKPSRSSAAWPGPLTRRYPKAPLIAALPVFV